MAKKKTGRKAPGLVKGLRMSAAPKGVTDLVKRFEDHLEAYRSGRYGETPLRREFIDPLFTQLGWDVANKAGHAEAYKDVIHEDAIKIGGVTKAPDYCFRIGGRRTFFLEAKKPSVDIATDVHPAYQLRRYAWSAKLPLSILTDFEEFAVYDCRVRPNPRDKASAARTMYLKYTDYVPKWDEIESIFAKDSVLKGSFDKYVAAGRKRGTAEVDAEFLKEIETWRGALARNIALRNARLSVRDLNFAVQRTIDRIIFLRMAEDRGVEEYATLQALINGTDVYARLMQMFRAADDRYNSGLFHFREKDPGHVGPPDTLTPEIKIDDKILKDIFKSLYYPASPYEFSVLPADILGNVYEQFLGKVIHLTAAHRARVEEKPEVKKAGGVYYTPKYIVDYIVKNTIGKLIEGKTPREISKMRFLDPACGSGSFLVGAYKFLLDYHRDWYLAQENGGPAKHKKQIYHGAGGQWYLTTAEKKRILLNNIYGVDIDPQAVEVTKLNLLLGVLENENQGTIDSQLKMWHERALPDLAGNIKCGNSLIGPDFYEAKQMALFDTDTQWKINAFDWAAEFPHILGPKAGKNPGFDAVIGNPPYVLLQTLGTPEVFAYLSSRYESATYKIDTYQVFLECAIAHTHIGGLTALITPNTFLMNKYAEALRRLILGNCKVNQIVLHDYQVFQGASVDTCITVLQRDRTGRSTHTSHVMRWSAPTKLGDHLTVRQATWEGLDGAEFNVMLSSDNVTLLRKVHESSVLLGDFATAYFGIQTFDRRKYVHAEASTELQRPVIDGESIGRYSLAPAREYVDFSENAIKSGGNRLVYEQERIAVRQIGRVPIGTILPQGLYTLNTIYNIYPVRRVQYDLRFLLGLINSRLLGFVWTSKFSDYKKTFPKVKKKPLLGLPIVNIDFSKPSDKVAHDRMVELVEQMLQLHKDLPAAKTPHHKTLLQRQIDATDKQIDQLVYELYDLMGEEIRIVEEGTT